MAWADAPSQPAWEIGSGLSVFASLGGGGSGKLFPRCQITSQVWLVRHNVIFKLLNLNDLR